MYTSAKENLFEDRKESSGKRVVWHFDYLDNMIRVV
jgi:hypothetical protein